MTDRLTPPMLRDLADIVAPDFGVDPDQYDIPLRRLSQYLHAEAARREAEAKPQKPTHEEIIAAQCRNYHSCHECGAPVGTACRKPTCPQLKKCDHGEREGPGSAAAPKPFPYYDDHGRPVNEAARAEFAANQKGRLHDPADVAAACRALGKPAPAADELVTRLRTRTAKYSALDGECLYEGDRDALLAADRIEAQAREIAGLTHDIASALDSVTKETEARAAAEARVREIAGLKIDEDAALTERDDALARLQAAEARVRELEADVASLNARHSAALDQRDTEKASADKLVAVLNLVERQIECQRNANTPAVAQDWTERALATIRAALASEGGDRG